MGLIRQVAVLFMHKKLKSFADIPCDNLSFLSFRMFLFIYYFFVCVFKKNKSPLAAIRSGTNFFLHMIFFCQNTLVFFF